MDLQLAVYLHALSQALGRKVRRIRYRVVRKPAIVPHKGETDAEYTARADARAPLKALKQRKTESDPEYTERSDAREAARPPLVKKVPEPIDDYLARVEELYRPGSPNLLEFDLTYTDAELDRTWLELWAAHRRILRVRAGSIQARETGRVDSANFPVRNRAACIKRSRCFFFDLCAGRVGTGAFRVHNPTPSTEQKP